MTNTDNEFLGKKIKSVPVKEQNIGIDLDNTVEKDLLDALNDDTLNKSNLEAFTQAAQSREQIYNLIDTMSQDGVVSAVLETYAEDITETNDAGNIVWVESSNEDVLETINYLLKVLRVDENIYEWAYNLVKYGDVYIRLYRLSDSLEVTKNEENKTLNEKLYLQLNAKGDKYNEYIEMVNNPGEMFELTKMGKTYSFIKAPSVFQQNIIRDSALNPYLNYRLNKADVTVFSATDFVHASIQNNNDRYREEVSLIREKDSSESDSDISQSSEEKYKVKKGQSLLYNSFKTWREVDLLKNSLLLNRLVRSAVVRILTVDVGDMPDERVRSYLQRIKAKIEQKSAVNVGTAMQNYNDTQPIENIIYIPKHGEQGSITQETIGGDVNVRDISDVSLLEDDLFTNFRVPKQFFNKTDDSTGFNGGTSLTIISSRYGKKIKSFQKLLCKMITDLINLYLIDMNKKGYLGKFKIRMQTPVTQEEIDKREATKNKLEEVGTIMTNLDSLITDENLKLELAKSLYSNILGNSSEIVSILQKQIDLNKKTEEKEKDKDENSEEPRPLDNEETFDNEPSEFSDNEDEDLFNYTPSDELGNEEVPMEEPSDLESEPLPTPSQLGVSI